MLPIPFPHRFQKVKLDAQFGKLLEMIKSLYMNIPFTKSLSQMPLYDKFIKEILSKKRKLEEFEIVSLIKQLGAIFQHKLPSKLKDPDSFSIPCDIGDFHIDRALYDLGVALRTPIILGRPFLVTIGATIGVKNGKLVLQVGEEQVIFNLFDTSTKPDVIYSCFRIDVTKGCEKDDVEVLYKTNLVILHTEDELVHDLAPSSLEDKIAALKIKSKPPSSKDQ
ncbi:uncharacterized protein LOC110608929 [Manihot esculenta]|uniref:uncharacterized protein LOC110608929 n=1 Tax=Manihot esculenta TaxID=3983 RepID=UPI000B5D1FF7|nr:uncharacterized protein LOC110608929 [Manihot esculenta]